MVRSVRRGGTRRITAPLRGFPFTAPTWPDTVPRESGPSHLGVDYDTDWARTPVSRAVRRLVVETVMCELEVKIADLIAAVLGATPEDEEIT